ncbi:GNAT family N-acetyltransferase [Candidatus Latescibacterota bacterium]
MRIDTVHMRDHLPDGNQDYINGYRALRLVDDEGELRGELVWRLAGRWNMRFEVKEMGIYRPADRRKGWGTKLMQAGIEDMIAFTDSLDRGHSPWLAYLFCEEENTGARAFYRSCGFTEGALLPDFDGPGDAAVLCTRVIRE